MFNVLGTLKNNFLFFFLNFRTKWKRQTSVGLELFVEAGNYAAYQRAYASRYGQLDGLPYPGNPLMLSGAHGMLPPPPPSSSASVANSAAELYYQQALQNSMAGMPPYNLYGNSAVAAAAALSRPVPIMHSVQSSNGFMPLNQLSSYYSAASLANATSPVSRATDTLNRSSSLSPSSASTPHSPQKTRSQTPTVPKSTNAAPTTDDESDIEV